jgi:transposase
VTERLEMEPGKLFLLRTIRPTFVSIEEPFAAPVTSPALVSLVEGQFFGASLLAELCLDKFLSHLPLYRQCQAFLWKHDVDLPLSTLCDAIGSCARQVDIVVRHMNQDLWAGGYVQMDLTPIRFFGQTTKSGAAATGQMWVTTVPAGDVVYHWRLTKQAVEAESIIPENFRGILQCDGGSELACWMKDVKQRRRPPPEGVRRAGCFAHVRRKLEEVWQDSGQQCKTSHEFLLLIADLYAVEAEARASGLAGEEHDALRLALRQERSVAAHGQTQNPPRPGTAQKPA